MRAQIQTNAFDRTDADTGQSGILLHPTLAQINHACVPNAAVSFSGRQAYLRAELPIKEGDEITISYIGRPSSVAGTLIDLDTDFLRLHQTQASPVPRPGTLSL